MQEPLPSLQKAEVYLRLRHLFSKNMMQNHQPLKSLTGDLQQWNKTSVLVRHVQMNYETHWDCFLDSYQEILFVLYNKKLPFSLLPFLPLHLSVSVHVIGLCTYLPIISPQPSCLKTRGRNWNNSVLQGKMPLLPKSLSFIYNLIVNIEVMYSWSSYSFTAQSKFFMTGNQQFWEVVIYTVLSFPQ